jgi:hypothetical protein
MLRGWLTGSARREGQQSNLTPAQRELLAASSREARLDELLGPAPAPPPAPKGVLPEPLF